MRIIKKNVDKDGSGTITLFPEEPEDMWHAFNLIRPGDKLRAPAIRRVTTESSTGSTSSNRVHTSFLTLVKSIDFDPAAGQLHISGQIVEENKYAKVGSFHTLDLELSRNFTLEKADGWDSIAFDVLREATDPEVRAEVMAVIMQEGLANICAITEHQTILRQRVEVSVPRKRQGRPNDHDKGLEKFFAQTLTTLLRHVDLSTPKPIVLASPGFTASSFQNHIKQSAINTNNKQLSAALPSIIVAHSSSGHVHALSEALSSPSVLAKLSDTKYARETQALDQFLTLLRKDDGRAWYGPNEVCLAIEKGAVGKGGGTLLISNSLFRSQKVGVRRKWVSVVDSVKAAGGEVRVFSSQHESGKRLEGLGSVAAILTFPLLDLDEGKDSEPDDGETVAQENGEQI
ncbi:MAG: Translation factor pelota [Piccolia ochrophora]|nr:MAG: Translation factor pelota [Piccolia ochrophora]